MKILIKWESLDQYLKIVLIFSTQKYSDARYLLFKGFIPVVYM